MAIKIDSFGGTDWTDGETLYSADLIETIEFARENPPTDSPVQEIYTGSGFNNTGTGSSYNSITHELNAVAAADAAKYNHVKVTVNYQSVLNSPSSSLTSVRIKPQIKETGGSYSDIIGFMTHRSRPYNQDEQTHAHSFSVLYELTSGMKSNGFQVQIETGALITSSGTAQLSNFQTTVELV